MKKSILILAVFLAATLVASSAPSPLFRSAHAQGVAGHKWSSELENALASADSIRVVVELEGDPLVNFELAMGRAQRGRIGVELDSVEAQGYQSQLIAQHEAFKTQAVSIAPDVHVNTELRVLLNAVSVEGPGKEIAALSSLPGVKQLYAVKECQSTLGASVPLINAPALWQQVGGSGTAGDGVKIAILDTGIDISNPLFSDAGFAAPAGFPRGNASFTNNKVIVAKAFLTDPTATPLDENGHGTNVAGISAGDFDTVTPLGSISGVAPHAYLGNYRVLNKKGSGPSDLIARALEEAVNDGFDVANLSLGSSADPTLDLLALAVENAVAAGMVVVVSAGNSGDQGRATIGTPGIAPSAITVGSTSNAHIVGPGAAVSVSGGAPASLTNIKSTQGDGASGSVGQFMVGPLPGVDVNALDAGGRGCGGLPGGSLAGKIALVERGNCNFSDKVNNAGAAGAVATIIFNKDLSEGSDGGDNLIFMSVPGTTIPSVFITRATGLALRDWLQTHPNAPVTIAPIPLADFPATADALSSFSSRGPSALGALKPDVSAPGDPVYSGAIKTANNSGVSDPSGFAAVSGTSQAAPHVAGSAALLLQLNPSWTPAQIKSALTSSADIQVFADSTASSTAGVLETGGGRIDLAKAGLATATFLPTNISFGFIKFKKKDVTRSMEVQIANVGGAQNKFTIAVEELNPGVGFTVTPSADSTTLAAGQSSTFSISVHATGKVAQRRDYTGYIVVTDESSSVLRLPYWVLLAKKKP